MNGYAVRRDNADVAEQMCRFFARKHPNGSEAKQALLEEADLHAADVIRLDRAARITGYVPGERVS